MHGRGLVGFHGTVLLLIMYDLLTLVLPSFQLGTELAI